MEVRPLNTLRFGNSPKYNIPTMVSELENDSDFAKKSDIPTDYAKKEHTHNQYLTHHQDLSAYAKKTDLPTVPTKTSQLTNDSGFLTQHQDLSAYAKKSEVTTHNTSDEAHSDIRLFITELTNRLNVLANSDDTTLDQMAEVVAYIKNNKSLIDSITTSKVNISDIIDNLTTSVSNKPLSAKQGVQLKALIDDITVPTKLSQLTNDNGYAKTTNHYTKTESDNKYQPIGNYLTAHQDISGKADKSSAETWTFTLEDGSTVTKKVVLA